MTFLGFLTRRGKAVVNGMLDHPRDKKETKMKGFSLKRMLAAAFIALCLAVALSTSAFAAQLPTKGNTPITPVKNTSATACTSWLIPQLAWHHWLEVQYRPAPQYVDLYQTEPVFGSQYPRVAVLRSTDGGKTFSFLGQYYPPFYDYDNLIYYSSGNIPFACVTGNWSASLV